MRSSIIGPVTGPCIPMSVVICSWTGSRVAFSIFIRSSARTNHHRSSLFLSFLSFSSLFPFSLFRLPSHLSRALQRPLHISYTVIHARKRREGHGWFEADSLVPMPVPSSIPPAGRRPQHCLYHRASLGPSAGLYTG